jgi:hypothetical protein
MRLPHLHSLSLILALSLPLGEPAGWAQAPGPARAELEQWPDTLTAHLEALALLETFNADLLSHDSATLTLERWCGAHQMASAPRVIAEKSAEFHPPSDLQRKELGVSASEPVRYRRVRLRCGEHVLSEAENWYVPARLTPQMNQLLEHTDVPFGRVVQPLHFSRHVLDATLLWSALPAGWDSGHATLTPHLPAWPDAQTPVLRHRAVLVLPDGRAISEVVETYTAAVLAFPEPRLERERRGRGGE